MNKVMKVGMVAACAALIVGCAKNSAELGEQVMREMQAELVKTPGLKALRMREVRLIKRDELNYQGVGKGEICGCPIKFDVKCQYDGSTVLWDADLSEDNLALLAAKEKAGEAYAAAKAAWPGVKAGLKAKFDAAVKKAGTCLDAAARQTEACCDEAARRGREAAKAVRAAAANAADRK